MNPTGSTVTSLPAPRRRLAPQRPRQAEGTWASDALSRVNAVAVLLVVVDVLAVATASVTAGLDSTWTLAVAALLLTVRGSSRLYRRRLRLSWLHELPRSVMATGTVFAALTCAALFLGASAAGTTTTQWTVLTFVAYSEPARAAVFALGRWCRKRFDRCDRSLVVGAGKVGADLVRAMLDHPEFGLRPVGCLDTGPVATPLPVDLLDEDLSEAIKRLRVGTVILAFSHGDSPLVEAAITAHRLGCNTLVVPRMYELHADGPDIERVRSYPLMRLGTAPTSRPSWWVKRGFDLVVAGVALIALAPVMALCALAVLVESGRPVLFRQVRVGMDDETFVLYKIRTVRMRGNDDSQIRWSVEGDARVGPVGRFLRRTALDELPQLWNIIRGEMSVVGPRPERPGFVREFSAIHELYWARHRVPTGLTGLAQVHGLRGDTSIGDRCRYDNYYIANWSLWLDLKILLMTVGELVCRRNR